MIATDTPILDDQALSQAALAAASALGLDGSVETTTDWPTDAGNAHVATAFRGVVAGGLHLVVDDEVAQRLLADPSLAPSVLGPVLESLGVPTDDIDVDPFAVAAGRPEKAVKLLRDGADPIWIGVTLDAEPGLREFQPTPVQPSFNDGGRGATMGSLAMLSDVDMDVTVELGRTKMPIRELLALQPGMVVEIDRAAGAPIDVLVNGRLIARGEVVVIDEEFGVRITEIISTETHA